MNATERNKRVTEILMRKDEIDAELTTLDETIHTLNEERGNLDAELSELIGISAPPPANGNGHTSGRKCRLCGQTGHIIARTKTADGRDTCPTYPNGKPLEE